MLACSCGFSAIESLLRGSLSKVGLPRNVSSSTGRDDKRESVGGLFKVCKTGRKTISFSGTIHHAAGLGARIRLLTFHYCCFARILPTEQISSVVGFLAG